MTVAELLNRISGRELREWQAFEQIYGPLGQQRDDYLAALIAQTTHNTVAKTAAPIGDFVLPWDEREVEGQGVDDGDGS